MHIAGEENSHLWSSGGHQIREVSKIRKLWRTATPAVFVLIGMHLFYGQLMDHLVEVKSADWSKTQETALLETFSFYERHFQAMSGDHFDIFRPFYTMQKEIKSTPGLLAPPEAWVAALTSKLEWMDTLTKGNENRSTADRAKAAYLQDLQMHSSGLVYGSEERRVRPELGVERVIIGPFNASDRAKGEDWTYLGLTMTGTLRLTNIEMLLQDVFRNKIPGDYIEAGVWRGGSSIFARGALRANDEASRLSYVCDSFRGLPPGEKRLDAADANWDHTPYLEVSAEIVARNFREMGLLDPNIVFAKGFFNETMKPLATQIKSLAIMRLDGDMYESTVDVLYHLYEKLSIGGYVIMDDWTGFPSRTACQDFFHVHDFNPEIIAIDDLSIYWKKTEEVDVQYWRYEQLQFK